MTVRILLGDCRDVLKTLPDQSVHCCVTSPPYWGLRSYLPPDHPDKHREIGSEPTVDEWVQTMVEVFREVRRVLRDDGTLWLNLGDSYAGSRCGGHTDASGLRNPGQKIDNSAEAKRLLRMTASRRRDDHPVPRSDLRVEGYKPKDLIGQPWLVAFALRADGWYLRQEIIWGKKNPMPESTRDRFTKAHEHVFLLSKSPRYYFDIDAVKEPVEGGAHARRPGNKRHSAADQYEAGDEHHRTKGGLVAYAERQRARDRVPAGWATGTNRQHEELDGRFTQERQRAVPPKTALATAENAGAYVDGKSERMGRGAGWRNKNNESFDEAMAVMPDMRNPRSVRWLASEPFYGAHFATYPTELIEPFILAGCPAGGTVLDPFGGSGTTGLVADRHGRDAVLIDLDPRNMPMAQQRIAGDAPLFADVEVQA